MKSIDLSELKAIQLDILKQIHKFCVEHQIGYSLACGTLLGAIRHKGYIPWDDDIDIYLLREDYNRLIELFPELYKGTYRLSSLEREADWERPYAKLHHIGTVMAENSCCKNIIGVNIDVYPIDQVPENEKEWMKYNKKRRFLQNLFSVKFIEINSSRPFHKNLVLILLKALLWPVSRKSFARFLSRYAQKYNSQKSCFVFENVQGMFVKRRFSKGIFSSFTDVPFEGCSFKGFQNYDEYLRNAYGNYMELPPVEKRVSHHSFHAYWKDSQ